MAELAVTTAWQLIVPVIFSSGVVVVLIESFRDWLFKRREQFVEQSKQKIDVISKATPYYNQIAMNSWNLGSNVIEAHNLDHQLLFYYMCNILQSREQIVQNFGDLQFDNLEAERIIGDFSRTITSTIRKKFTSVEYSRLSYLTTHNKPYHKFHENLSQDENKVLYDKFVAWIKSGEDKEMFEKCMWYSQLIMLELNHIYKSWYGQEPPLILRPNLKKYLSEKEKKYYERIKSFHIKTLLQKNLSKHSESK